MKPKLTFLSDNASGVHPKVLQAIKDANTGHESPYGSDNYTKKLESYFMDVLGSNVTAFPVFAGTAANNLCLKHMTRPFQSILATDCSHIYRSETGAVESNTGCRIETLKHVHGKLTLDNLKRHPLPFSDIHSPQPKIVSISEPTEYGTVYTLQELKAITEYVHSWGGLVHMDGARIFQALQFLKTDLKSLLIDTKIDAVSFGGTKSGMMFGECILFLKPELADNFVYVRKNMLQLASKMRFISAQFLSLLTENIGLEMAAETQILSKKLADGLTAKGIEITSPVETNVVFAKAKRERIEHWKRDFDFNIWDSSDYQYPEVRLMTTFDQTSSFIDSFLQQV